MTRIGCVRAHNPSPMTLSGTNSYILDDGAGHAICIDPGPAIPAHIDAIVRICEKLECTIEWICLTHGHPDHAPGATLLRERVNARIAAHPKNLLTHDRELRDNDTVVAGGVALRGIETPGHSADHLVFHDETIRALFTGDLVLGEGYVLIAAPDGDMRAYQTSLRRLLHDFGETETIFPGHGEPVSDPTGKLRDYLDHRAAREAQVLAALQNGARTIAELTRTVYPQIDKALTQAAATQILAHLIALEREDRVHSENRLGATTYALTR
ncbi:MAG TPA: MBL fold metallo-hydrolase [Candidatus Rubrimentiphilum sp.]|nr:MBL fold metallo-hydrolase [Candidatus Rubrimentiphilum sp.]